MSKAPSMPMYWDAYLADTTHLTTEEHGAYLLLLAAMWRRNGCVPNDDKDNARILGLTKAKWVKVKSRLAPLLTITDDKITQEKLLEIWENTQEKIEKNRANGAKGGRPKSSDNNSLAKANGSVSDNPNETIPEPEPEPEPKAREETNVSCAPSPANALSEAVSIYNEAAEHAGWPKVQKLTPSRAKSLRARLKDCGGIEGWREALRRAYASDFIREEWNGFGFNSLISQEKFTRLMEGNYDNRTRTSRQTAQRPDPALEQIARLAGLGSTSSNGGF
jgi:uncharacterized protein YdaU (DUF1376 family)